MRFLTETTAQQEIAKMLASASSAKIAVAFWGAGAIDLLSIDKSPSRKQVICNLESGACNPNEIRMLRSSPNIDIRTNPRLHAKVYWSEQQAVIGSSNASTNGLVVEGQTALGWAEANILTTDPALLQETGEWFDRLFADSDPVSDEALAKAEDVWRQRRMIEPPEPKRKQPITSQQDVPRNGEARLKAAFHQEMMRIYEDAKAAGYTPSYLRQSLATKGGYITAVNFVSRREGTAGFFRLVELGHPELTVEHLMLEPRWRSLFGDDLLSLAHARLKSIDR